MSGQASERMPRGQRTEGTVLHADLDSFFAAVEQRDDPALRRRPVIVGGGVVLAASYEARARGVRTAMGGRQARRLCPEAVVVPPRMEAYAEASRATFAVFVDTTPYVEGLSVDEAFLEVGGLRRLRGDRGAPSTIAAELRRRVRAEVGLPISVGVARTKHLAKIASAVSKPDGLLVVPVEDETLFLHALPVGRLWGVGAVTGHKLAEVGIRTVGQLAALDSGEVTRLLGLAAGRHLHALAHGRDPRPVETGRRRRSMGAQHALGSGPHSAAEIDRVLAGLVDRVTGRMRAAERPGSTVTLRLRFADFSRSTSSHTLARPTWSTAEVLGLVRLLLASRAEEIAERGLTLVGVAVSGLDDHPAQPALPFDERADGDLDIVLDAVRRRYGSRAVRRAAQIGRPERAVMPRLGD